MSELERIISKYLSKDETAITYSDNQEKVNKLFQNMEYMNAQIFYQYMITKWLLLNILNLIAIKIHEKGVTLKFKIMQQKKTMRNKRNNELKIEKEMWIQNEIKNTVQLKKKMITIQKYNIKN